MFLKSGVPRHFLLRFIAVWIYNLTVFMLCMSMLTSNSSGSMQKHRYLGCFHAASARENISWVWVISGRIRLSVSTVNRTYELSGITHVTLFLKYGKHSTGPSTYGPWVRTYSKSFSCKPVLTVCSHRAQSNEICTYVRVSSGSVPRVRRFGLLYLRAVEFNHRHLIAVTS